MSFFEKSLLSEINHLRTNPSNYASKLLSYETQFENKVFHPSSSEKGGIITKEGFSVVKEASSYLKTLSPRKELQFNKTLSQIAADLSEIYRVHYGQAINSEDFNRITSNYGEYLGLFAESVDLGSCLPEIVVFNLLCDDGNKERPNRKNLLSEDLKEIGISHEKHKDYKYITVICYVEMFVEKGREGKEKGMNDKENRIFKSGKENFQVDDDPHVLKAKFLGYVVDEKGKSKSKEKEKEKEKDKYVDPYDEDDLPEGVEKIEKIEMMKEDGHGNKYKVLKVIKHMNDGTIRTEIQRK